MQIADKLLTDFRETTVIRITCLAWLAAKVISWKLWLPYRLFPVLPSFDFVPEFPNYFHFILYVLSLAAMFATVFFPKKKILLLVVIVAEIASCLADLMRWQPWEYQFLLTFILFYCFHGNARRFLELFSFLISATYILSALHKFNETFLKDVWDGFLLHLFGFSERFVASDWVHYSGLLMGIVELSIGLGFLFFKNKKKFVVLCLAMHVSILLILGPIGLNINQVVWPWNLAMPMLVWVLFYKNPVGFAKDFVKPWGNKLVFLFVGILPLFNFLGLWDDYLSFCLYAGGNEKMLICFEPDDRKPELNKYTTAPYCGEDQVTISVTKWAFLEMEVPMYPEERAYRKFKEQWNKKYPNNRNTFLIYDFPYGQNDVREVK